MPRKRKETPPPKPPKPTRTEIETFMEPDAYWLGQLRKSGASCFNGIILCFGCDEDSDMSCLIMRNRKGFAKPEDALRDIGEAFVEAIHEENQYRRRPCCEKHSGKYCPECGGRLDKPATPDEEEVAQRAREFARSTAVECGQENWEALDQRGWEFGVRKGNPFRNGFVHVEENAEYVIAAAIHGTFDSSCYTERNQVKIVK